MFGREDGIRQHDRLSELNRRAGCDSSLAREVWKHEQDARGTRQDTSDNFILTQVTQKD